MPTLYSQDQILVTHAGALPRPADVRPLVMAKSRGETIDQAALDAKLKTAVAEVVKQQVKSGIDSVNDGELSKSNFTDYIRTAHGGLRDAPDRSAPPPRDHRARSHQVRRLFRIDLESARPAAAARSGDASSLHREAALYRSGRSESRSRQFQSRDSPAPKLPRPICPANTPGTIEHWLRNEYYKNEEEFVFAIADMLHEEYKAIVDAGFLLQIDDPDLPDGWNCLPEHVGGGISQIRAAARRCAQPRAARHSAREDAAACLLGQLPRPASRRHPA